MKATLISELRALPGAFRVLVLGTFINRFGSFVFPFLTLFLTGRGVSLSWVGIVLTGFGTGALAATLVGGWFADRFGRRNTIVWGTFAQAITVGCLYFAEAPIWLAIVTALCGFAGGFYHPAASALVADLVPQERRLTAFTMMRLAGNAGFAFGTALGGFLVKNNPFWLFAGDALTTLAFGVLALLLLPHGLRSSGLQARWSEALLRLKNDGGFWALFSAQLGVAFVFAQFAGAYSLEVTRRGITLPLFGGVLALEQVYGLLIGWNGILIMAFELPMTRLTRAYSPSKVMATGYVLVGLGFTTNALVGGFALLACGMSIFSIGEMLVMPMVGVWIARIAPERMRGRYMGALSGAWALGSILGQNVGMNLFALRPEALWIACGAVSIGSALAITLMNRNKESACLPVAELPQDPAG